MKGFHFLRFLDKLFRNPNYDDLVWPVHNFSQEFYMDIGTHMIEKNGLFLERYSVWDQFETSSAVSYNLKIFWLLVFLALNFKF